MDERPRRSPDEPLGMPGATREDNLLEWLYALRDKQRAQKNNAAWLIKGKDLNWEHNRQGKMKWYLHPALEDACIRSMLFFEQEIPPGGRTGAQKTPGGAVMYIMQGHGFTLLDGVRHDWEAEDVVNIPIRTDGVVVQHVNLDPNEPVVFLCADLNLIDLLGVDRGAELDQVESAPDYEEKRG
jgi:gentisate 1,2-dioxygenase